MTQIDLILDDERSVICLLLDNFSSVEFDLFEFAVCLISPFNIMDTFWILKNPCN